MKQMKGLIYLSRYDAGGEGGKISRWGGGGGGE